MAGAVINTNTVVTLLSKSPLRGDSTKDDR
jgi:hypothetical protein